MSGDVSQSRVAIRRRLYVASILGEVQFLISGIEHENPAA